MVTQGCKVKGCFPCLVTLRDHLFCRKIDGKGRADAWDASLSVMKEQCAGKATPLYILRILLMRRCFKRQFPRHACACNAKVR